jgi:hypothetical protein
MEHRRFVWLVVMTACCAPPRDAHPRDGVADAFLIVPATRVGAYTIGHDTMTTVYRGDDGERSRLEERGLWFEFTRGTTLTGITVTAADYATRAHLRVGSTVVDVRAAMGDVAEQTLHDVQAKGLHIPALVYPGITFMVHDGRVYAIHVGN